MARVRGHHGRASASLTAIATAIAALAVAVAVPSSASAFGVTGYLEAGGAGPALIAAEADGLSDVGVDGGTLVAGGAEVEVPPGAHAALQAAHAAGLPASLLVSNYDNRIGDFSPALGAALLRDPRKRASVASALASEVSAAGWDGVTVDLEALRPGDRSGLVAFLTVLREELPAGTTIEIDLPASTEGGGGREWAPFDVAAIAAVVDRAVVMAYDQHYETGPPGPIAALPWVRRVLAVAVPAIPPAKLRLGIAGYGYLWRPGRPTRSLGDAAARRLAGSRARWSAASAEWHATLPGGGRLWWSDRRSQRSRITLAEAAGLDGVALWRLGASDPLP